VNAPTPTAQPRKLSRRFWVWTGIFSVAFVLLVTALCNLFLDVPLRISKETTYITEPLTADGTRVDYFAAIEQQRYPPEMQTDENGYRMLVRAIGPSAELGAVEQRQVYEKLGLKPDTMPTLAFEDHFTFLERYVKAMPTPVTVPVEEPSVEEPTTTPSDQPNEEVLDTDTDEEWFDEEPEVNPLDDFYDRSGRPWTLTDLPMLEPWLKTNGPVLDLLGEAVRKPVFCAPLTRSDESRMLATLMFPGEMQRCRSLARGLQARAYYRIGSGDIDGAVYDIETMHRLSRHLSTKASSMIEALVGIAIESIANATNVAGSLEHLPSLAQLQRHAKSLDAIPPQASFDDVAVCERLVSLEAVQAFPTQIEAMGKDVALEWRSGRGYDWNIVAEHMNRIYDNGFTTTPLPAKSQFARLFRGPRSHMLGRTLAELLASAIGSVEGAFDRAICQENLLRITLAMLIYERQHGTLPPAYSADAAGKPLHSWRVLLLPALGFDELYGKLRLDEPWDSTHNQQFHKEVVAVYQCPSAQLDPGMTEYTVIVGAKTAFEGSEGKRLDAFGPKSANMILVAERLEPVCWMDPTHEVTEADAKIGINNSYGSTTAVLGSNHPGGMQVGLRSGGVTFLSENFDLALFAELLEGTNDLIP